MVFCPVAIAVPNRKFDFLLHFFDLNEKAFAYHRHCLSQSESINPVFLENLELVANELFAQAKKDDPNMAPEYIKNKILERRYNLQYKLDYEHMNKGCYSSYLEEAKIHYQAFSHHTKKDVRAFIEERTQD